MSFNHITVINKPFARWRLTTVSTTTTAIATATAKTATTIPESFRSLLFLCKLGLLLFHPHWVYQIWIRRKSEMSNSDSPLGIKPIYQGCYTVNLLLVPRIWGKEYQSKIPVLYMSKELLSLMDRLRPLDKVFLQPQLSSWPHGNFACWGKISIRFPTQCESRSTCYVPYKLEEHYLWLADEKIKEEMIILVRSNIPTLAAIYAKFKWQGNMA